MGNALGSVGILNNSNIYVNVALCVVAQYYQANKVIPGYAGMWDNVGHVYFTVVMVPWYGPASEFGQCIAVYHDYMKRIPELARTISQRGYVDLDRIRITGKNVTLGEAMERLRGLAFWGNGFKVTGKSVSFAGGPPATDTTRGPTIDISQHFENFRLNLLDGAYNVPPLDNAVDEAPPAKEDEEEEVKDDDNGYEWVKVRRKD